MIPKIRNPSPEEAKAIRDLISETVNDASVTVDGPRPACFTIRFPCSVFVLFLREDERLWSGWTSFDLHDAENFRQGLRNHLATRTQLLPKLEK